MENWIIFQNVNSSATVITSPDVKTQVMSVQCTMWWRAGEERANREGTRQDGGEMGNVQTDVLSPGVSMYVPVNSSR